MPGTYLHSPSFLGPSGISSGMASSLTNEAPSSRVSSMTVPSEASQFLVSVSAFVSGSSPPASWKV